MSIEDVQRRLDDKGVREVKVCFCPSVCLMPAEKVKRDLDFIFSTYLDGHVDELPYFNDGNGIR